MWRLPLLLLAATSWAQQPGSMSFPTYLEGLEALAEGDYAAAEAHFTDCIAHDVVEVRYHIARAVSRALAEKLAEAQSDIDDARGIDPKHDEARAWDWTIGTMANRAWKESPPPPKDAYEMFLRETASEYARDGDARGGALARLPDVAAWFVHRAKADKRLAPLLLAHAAQQYDDKEYEQALYNLEHVLAHQPDDVNLLFHRANCRYALGDWEGARRDLTAVLELDPSRSQAYARRAVAEARVGNRWRAEADLEIALALVPGQAETVRQEVEQTLKPMLKAPTPGDVAVCLFEMTQEAASNSPDAAKAAASAMYLHQLAASLFPTPDENDEARIRVLEELGGQGKIDAKRSENLVGDYPYNRDAGFVTPRPSFDKCLTETRAHMDVKAWDKACAALEHAAMTDSANPLLHALWARVDSEAGQWRESVVRARLALYLEEARARMSGSELAGEDATTPLRPSDAVLAIQMHYHLASYFDSLGQPDEARAHVRCAGGLVARVPPWDRASEAETTDGPCRFDAVVDWLREFEVKLGRDDD